ncbi:elongator complex protein 6 [Phymastichus coffea]|uniref:elongator complex protein 6 n=1 Tax=Phymastichus coffea TaxID=108790 RepID=UPI00273C4BE9|nr:elongator complex protein 6 [Phymastichus coffea]XP_058803758.1 elongator complex protein 6 [Phymastichus coffea]XP_058803759.1 elongator complex protein 6 [Phymastichus coffea]
MEDVREAIGIEKVDMSGKLIFVEEHHKADANFIYHTLTSHCMEKNNIICFVLFHNTFGHFHNVGMKLDYNLKKVQDKNVKVIEPLRLVTRNMEMSTSNLVKELAGIIQIKCISTEKESVDQKVYVIIDDLSHLFDIGLSMEDVWLFTRYLRSFVKQEPFFTVCIGSHIYKSLGHQCLPNLAAVVLKHFADLIISVQPLETGFSKSASGKVIVYWKASNERHKFKWPKETMYLYKLLDRQVKLFEPGSSCIM